MTICYWDPLNGCYVARWVPLYWAVMNGWAYTPETSEKP